MKKPIELMLDKLDYTPTNFKPTDDGLPYVTHEGVLNFGSIEIRVCILSTGERIIPEDELIKVFGDRTLMKFKL